MDKERVPILHVNSDNNEISILACSKCEPMCISRAPSVFKKGKSSMYLSYSLILMENDKQWQLDQLVPPVAQVSHAHRNYMAPSSPVSPPLSLPGAPRPHLRMLLILHSVLLCHLLFLRATADMAPLCACRNCDAYAFWSCRPSALSRTLS